MDTCAVGGSKRHIVNLSDSRHYPFLGSRGLYHLIITCNSGILSRAYAAFPQRRRQFPARARGVLVPYYPTMVSL